MYYPQLAESVKHFKKEKGKEDMCKAVEDYAKEYAKEYAADITAEKEKIEAKNENLEVEVKELRARLAKYETV